MDTPTATSWIAGDELTTPSIRCAVAELAYFRVETRIEQAVVGAVPVELTAESRYRLTVNEVLVSAGPAKPSGGVWFVDTIDISGHLRVGVNVIGIEVLSYSVDRTGNASILRTGSPGLSVSGSLPNGTDLADPRTWRWRPVPGRRFRQGENTVFLGIQEDVDGKLVPHGWLSAGFDDSSWPVPTGDGAPAFLDRIQRPRTLPRPIPALTLDRVEFTAVTASTDDELDWDAFIAGAEDVEIGPHRTVQVDLDAAELITAYLGLQLVGGAGATVELTAAECYELEPVEIPWQRRKGDRTDAVNGDLYGDPDTYRPAGVGTDNRPERFTPYWFRTFRYLRLKITTADSPIRLAGLAVTRTHYPLAIEGTFSSSTASDTRLWDTSVRTLLNCMHETFEDCPFYEQLQYAMDTRSQALFTLHLSTDDRLVRRAIEDFAASGDPNGLTESRTPCVQPQFIPGFSLFWIFMVADHLDHVGDRAFTGRFLGRIDAVLGYFDRSLSDEGFVLSPPDDQHVWNFVDWTQEWTATRGVPDLGARRANTITTFMYIAALRSAATIAAHCGRPGLAGEYHSRAADLSGRITTQAWDPSTGYVRDSDTGRPQSQHAQVWAVLSESVTGRSAAALLRRAMADDSLAVCSYAMSLSLFDALRMAGLDELISWQPWHDMLAVGLTTWAEDTVSNRSDCHAWGSVPLQQFPRYVLGVRPSAPGFDAVTIDPVPSDRDFAEGTVPTPHGTIQVRWERTDADSRLIRVRMPATVKFDLGSRAHIVSERIIGDTRELSYQQTSPSAALPNLR
ncbi:MAG TPA: alpha-L-rhamnosidase C-terminal domain-containing protein [Nakamurella sp.]